MAEKDGSWRPWLMLAPAVTTVTLLLVVPVCFIVVYSFWLRSAAGGHVRVGLEDSLTDGRGRALAPSNAHQVGRIRRILEEMGFAVASPAEARAMLDLKGAGRVGF